MNIFYLHSDPSLCAQQYCDKILVRMILETGQMLCQVLTNIGVGQPTFYKTKNEYHPTLSWAKRTYTNLKWAYNLFVEMSNEYTFRTGKVHKTTQTFKRLFNEIIQNEAHDYYRRDSYGAPRIYCNTHTYSSLVCPHYAPPQVVHKNFRVSRGRRMRLGAHLGEYQILATIMAYRRMYLREKAPFAKWTKRDPPTWFTTNDLWDIMNKMLAIERLLRTTPDNRTRISETGEPFFIITQGPRPINLINMVRPEMERAAQQNQFEPPWGRTEGIRDFQAQFLNDVIPPPQGLVDAVADIDRPMPQFINFRNEFLLSRTRINNDVITINTMDI